MIVKKLGLPTVLIAVCMLIVHSGCAKKEKKEGADTTLPAAFGKVDVWLTKADQSVLLQKQVAPISFATGTNVYESIEVDSAIAYQQVDGFGYTLTGGSAYLINQVMSAEARLSLLNELFGAGTNSIGISYLRVSLGASDLSANVFSYNDMPAGQTDPLLTNFSLAADTVDLIPLLKQILKINPSIKIMASPWSPPVWMKDNASSVGGNLRLQYYNLYATYFVKYIQAMQANGIAIDAITIQNEPEHGGNNPSMLMTANQQANFIKNNLGPVFQAAGIKTKIIIWDHNCDNPNYPITVLNDEAAKKYINGSAFHLYAGDISALTTVYNAHPDKALYFTEQWTGANSSFSGDLVWHTKNVIIGSMRNQSRIALEWNLANNSSYGPHTQGGCTECKGALTISSVVVRNVGYYIVAHASKFVPAGSVRISSNIISNLPNVAFKTPDGKKVLIVVNEGSAAVGFNIKYQGKIAFTSLSAGAVGTFVW